jgi:hypothetical protein
MPAGLGLPAGPARTGKTGTITLMVRIGYDPPRLF